tara:strand:+ start:117 stop:671 length:555 start_codon:yes stop_codon:yes gene_type:complete
MNLGEQLCNKTFKKNAEIDNMCTRISEDIYIKISESAFISANHGLNYVKKFYFLQELDTLDLTEKSVQHYYKRTIENKIRSMLYPKSSQSRNFWNSVYINITFKNKIMKVSKISIRLSWKIIQEAVTVPKSNLKINCPICFEKKSAMSLSCGHLICDDCCPGLIHKNCPICRTLCTHMHAIYEA